jgi:integrase/recombinase XerC
VIAGGDGFVMNTNTSQWHDALGRYQSWMLSGETASTTIRVYLHYIRRLADKVAPLGPFEVGIDELAAFLAVRSWRPATRKTARSALRSFYRWACETGRLVTDPSERLRPIRVRAGLPRPAPDDAVERAFAHATPRDRLMVMLACYAGLRRGEIAQVHRHDLFGGVVRVHGKGERDRDVPLHPVLIEALRCWPERGYLFPGMVHGHISADRVGHILGELLGAGWTGHTLRHRFLSLAYQADRDVRAVQTLAGHAKLDSTMIYTKVPDGALLRAVLAAGPQVAA